MSTAVLFQVAFRFGCGGVSGGFFVKEFCTLAISMLEVEGFRVPLGARPSFTRALKSRLNSWFGEPEVPISCWLGPLWISGCRVLQLRLKTSLVWRQSPKFMSETPSRIEFFHDVGANSIQGWQQRSGSLFAATCQHKDAAFTESLGPSCKQP